MNMTKTYWQISFLVLVIILGLSLAACADNNNTSVPALNAATQAITTNKSTTTIPTLTATTSPTPVQDWQRKWLQGIPCAAPCWEGITPGVTTYDEAVKILQTLPGIRDIKFAEYPAQSTVMWKEDEKKVVTWGWGENWGGGKLIAQLTGKQLVRFISSGYRSSYTLKEIIDAYGEPQFIVPYTQADPEFQTYSVDFIFANKGFTVGIGGSKPITLANNLIFEEVGMYGPTLEDYKQVSHGRDEWIQPWQGFKEYDYSCIKVAYLINGCGKMPVKLP